MPNGENEEQPIQGEELETDNGAPEYPPSLEYLLDQLMDYLQTEKGHEFANRIVTWIEDNQKATTEQKKCEVEFQHDTTRLWLVLQAGAITVIIVVAALLAWHGKLDATVATLMATLFGYFLGKTR
jgi:ABC-type proline/glycine betaine transport system permease subunit